MKIILILMILLISLPIFSMEQVDLKRFSDDIKDVEEYLSNFETMESDFMQLSGLGDRSRGKVSIKRSGKSRWEYDIPAKLLIITRNGRLTYYDYGLQQVSYAAVPDTPLNILLEKNIKLTEAAEITQIRKTDHSLEISLSPKDKKSEWKDAVLKLVFGTRPIRLKRAIQTDPSGHMTHITFKKPTFDKKMDDDLFIFNDPRKNKSYPN